MATELKITQQEKKFIDYLNGKNEASWEELVQFTSNPQSIKLKTVKKVVSEIKRKYNAAGLPLPFTTHLVSLASSSNKTDAVNQQPINFDQQLVPVMRSGGTMVKKDTTKHQAQLDFAPDPQGFRKVITKFGPHQLNDNEWDMYKYFYNNVGKLVTISELRDKVVFPNFGSKLPARWFDSIMRIINNLRKQVPGLKERLLTVKGSEGTSYIFQ